MSKKDDTPRSPHRYTEIKIYKIIILSAPVIVLLLSLVTIFGPGDANIGLGFVMYLSVTTATVVSVILLFRGRGNDRRFGLIAFLALIIVPILLNSVFNEIDQRLYCKGQVQSGQPILKDGLAKCKSLYPDYDFKTID